MTAEALGSAAPRPSERRSELRGLIALCRERLRRTTGARIAAFGAGVVFFVAMVIAIALRLEDGADARLGAVLATAARWAGWLVGAPLALSLAHDRRAQDAEDGIETLAATRGFSGRALESARTLAGMIHVAILLAAPLISVALVTIALSGSVATAVARVPFLLAAAAFGAIAGTALGGIATACGLVGASKGRWLLAAVVLLPWIVAAELGRSAWSIPGALNAVLAFLLPGAGAETGT